jgi:hypothetical protein
MDVLDVLENRTLESHTSVREKRQRQATLLLFVQKFRSGVDQFPKFAKVEAMSVNVTNYASKPAIFVQSCACFG